MIDIRNIAKGKNVAVLRDMVLDIPVGYGVLDKTAVAHVEGELTNEDGIFVFIGHAALVVNMECSLCLKSVSVPVSFDMTESFRESEDKGDDEAIMITDKEIDLKPVVESNFCIHIPMKQLCTPDCKGLCPKCGADLNEGKCDCETVHIDERFAGLLSMFNDESDKEKND